MMNGPEKRYCKDSKVVKTSRVFPLDTNNHNTLFGGKLMSLYRRYRFDFGSETTRGVKP